MQLLSEFQFSVPSDETAEPAGVRLLRQSTCLSAGNPAIWALIGRLWDWDWSSGKPSQISQAQAVEAEQPPAPVPGFANNFAEKEIE